MSGKQTKQVKNKSFLKCIMILFVSPHACMLSVQDHFARYPAHGFLATTHLIMKYPSGDKYSFSLKWGVPALTDMWVHRLSFTITVCTRLMHLNPCIHVYLNSMYMWLAVILGSLITHTGT